MDTTRASLLIRIRDPRNSTAWAEFDSIYRPMLERFARIQGLRPVDTDDLVQACMVAIHKHIESFEYDPGKGRFKGWLKTMVGNKVRNFFRDNQREQTAESHDFQRVDESEETPDTAFDRLWMDEHLRHCLSLVRHEIDEATFDAFCKYVIEEQPVETVCARFGISTQQLYKIKWRLTQKLGEKMKELLGDDE